MSKENSISKTLVWVLMGLLIFGLGGFGITNLGGSVTSVGSVNGKDIDVNRYARALQQEMDAIRAQTGTSLSFAQAQALQLDRQVLAQLLNARALDAEAERLGLSMGDENLRQQILSIAAFQGLDGTFDREAYRFALQSSGLNEGDFEDSLREDAARGLLQSAVLGGIEMPTTYADTILGYLGEQRSFSIATLTEANLDAPIAEADEATLKAYYDANTALFMRPATRDITYAWLTPNMLIDSIEVDEDSLRAEYEARDAEFNQPERRLVERLVFGTADEATAALAQINAEETTFDALVAARGLALSDVDLGDVSKASLGDAGEVVFAADANTVVGPVQSDLGPALFRVNGILSAQTTTYEDALPQLRDALAADRARRVVDAQINEIDDLLAGGATLEELAGETDMVLGQVNWHTGESAGISGYADFRAIAQTVTTSDFPQVEQLDDGGIFALRLDGETEAAPAPFDDARDAVAAAWKAEQLSAALMAQGEELQAKMKAGADIVTLGLNVVQETDVTRSDFIPDVPADFLSAVFEMTVGETRLVAAGPELLIVELDATAPADLESAEANSLRSLLSQQASQSLAQDVLNIYSAQIRGNADVQIDQNALSAIHAQMQ
jgi:peptidyl-prolyl cis-trans isomerase D